MRSLLAIFTSAALLAYASAKETAPAPAATEIAGAPLVLNGEATRTVWGFEVYRVRLYLQAVMREAERILGAKSEPKRIEIVMLREVGEQQFTTAVQQSIDNNFSDGEKQKFALQLSDFLGCFNNGVELKPGNVITIDYAPADGMVVKLDGRTLDTIPGADFYHAILRLWLGKPLQKSIKDGLLGAAG